MRTEMKICHEKVSQNCTTDINTSNATRILKTTMMLKQALQVTLFLTMSMVKTSTAFLPPLTVGRVATKSASPYSSDYEKARTFALAASRTGDIKEAADNAADSVGDAADKAADSVKGAVDTGEESATGAWEKTKDVAGDIKDSVKEKAVGVKDGVKSAAGSVTGSVKSAAGSVKHTVTDAAGAVKDKVVDAKHKVADKLSED